MTVTSIDQQIAESISGKLNITQKVAIHSLISSGVQDELLNAPANVQTRLIFATVDDCLSVAVLAIEYSTDSGKVVYLEKLDTTNVRLPGLARTVVQSYLELQSARIFVFARSQPQYLFHRSAESSKSSLSGRKLVRWWQKSLSIAGSTNKHILVPGEASVAYKLPNWTWGLDAPPDANAVDTIYQFKDDVKQKAIVSMLNSDAKVSDLVETLPVMAEFSADVAGLFSLTCNGDGRIEDATEEGTFIEYLGKWMSCEFHDSAHIRKSSIDLISQWESITGREGAQCDCSKQSEVANAGNAVKSTSIVTIQGLVKRKEPTVVKSVQGLIKKKHKTID